MNTNQIDQRVRSTSLEETQFLGSRVAGTGLGVTYKQLEKAGRVLIVGLEAEDDRNCLPATAQGRFGGNGKGFSCRSVYNAFH